MTREPSPITASEQAYLLMEIAATAPENLKARVAESTDPESALGLLTGALAAQAGALVLSLAQATRQDVPATLAMLRRTLTLAQLDPSPPSGEEAGEP